MKRAIFTALLVGAVFGAGLGVGAMAMLVLGVMQKPERVVETRWIHPPTTTTTFGGYTPLSAEEQDRLDKAIAQIDLPTTTTRPLPPTTVATAPPTPAPAPAPVVSTTITEPTTTTTEPTTTVATY